MQILSYIFTPLAIMLVLIVALVRIMFDLLYELFEHLLEADKND